MLVSLVTHSGVASESLRGSVLLSYKPLSASYRAPAAATFWVQLFRCEVTWVVETSSYCQRVQDPR